VWSERSENTPPTNQGVFSERGALTSQNLRSGPAWCWKRKRALLFEGHLVFLLCLDARALGRHRKRTAEFDGHMCAESCPSMMSSGGRTSLVALLRATDRSVDPVEAEPATDRHHPEPDDRYRRHLHSPPWPVPGTGIPVPHRSHRCSSWSVGLGRVDGTRAERDPNGGPTYAGTSGEPPACGQPVNGVPGVFRPKASTSRHPGRRPPAGLSR
jgi:hypothetical protein